MVPRNHHVALGRAQKSFSGPVCPPTFLSKKQRNRRKRQSEYFKAKYGKMPQRLALRSRQLSRGTRIELMVKTALENAGLDFKFQKGFLCKGTAVRLVDFMLTGNAIFLEIDGPEHDPIKDAERERQILLCKPGYTFLRIKNQEVLDNQDGLEAYLLNRIWKHRLSIKNRFLGNVDPTTQGREGIKEVSVKSGGVDESTLGTADDKTRRCICQTDSPEGIGSELVPVPTASVLQ